MNETTTTSLLQLCDPAAVLNALPAPVLFDTIDAMPMRQQEMGNLN